MCASRHLWTTRLLFAMTTRKVPPRSMVGHLPLEQAIGVRIPGGQPIPVLRRPLSNLPEPS